MIKQTFIFCAVLLGLYACASQEPIQTSPAAANTSTQSAPNQNYAAVAQMLQGFIAHEMASKQLPALSIALVDDQQVVWAQGFGEARPGTPATATTVYRVGSVSKLFTDIAIMQQVELGKLDLDAPVSRYLPEFAPRNPYAAPITLRQLMSHRSGLVREPPVGSYFDPAEPTLAQTVASLNDTALVYAPGTRIKYSNAAIATAGYVLERNQNEPFAKLLKRNVLNPLGMQHSSFEPEAGITRDLAAAKMWTVDGREFDAPKFQLGVAPAGSMYSDVLDLGKFMSALFAGGQPILKQATLEQMWTPQFPNSKTGGKGNFGIGFHLSEMEGHRRVGHGGAIYGFATSLDMLPDDKLGVVVTTTVDVANAVTGRIASVALKAMLAARQGQPIVAPQMNLAPAPELARRVAGRYVSKGKGWDLTESAGKLSLLNIHGGWPARLAQSASADELIVDDRIDYGKKITLRENAIVVDGETYARAKSVKPKSASKRWRGLIGEYGWDHEILYIFEKDGQLWSLIEWFEFSKLKQISRDVYAFPDHGLYAGERLVFTRDAKDRATQVVAANVRFARRSVGPEDGAAQLMIQPVRPVPELIKEAQAATPPKEVGEFRTPDLVELTALDKSIKLDVRYATTNNFLGTVFYSEPRAFLQRAAAEALVRAHRGLKSAGYGLLIHDAYRPWYVTRVFWDATPEDKHLFVADPSQGSRHNRGAAVDLTLYDLKTGEPVQMVGTYDETTDRSYPDYPGGSSEQRWLRQLLRERMEAQGFNVFSAEWWHFDYADWKKYPITNLHFDKIAPK